MTIETIICKNCGKEHTYVRIRKSKIYCSKKCGEQYNNRYNRDREAERKRLATYRQKHPEKTICSTFRTKATKAGLAFDLTPEWIAKHLNRGRCELTHLPIKIKQYKKGALGVRDFLSPSFDRIDNSKGYTKDNVRCVCWGYNLVKNAFTDRDVESLALSLVLNNMASKQQKELLEMLPDAFKANLHSGSPFSNLLMEA